MFRILTALLLFTSPLAADEGGQVPAAASSATVLPGAPRMAVLIVGVAAVLLTFHQALAGKKRNA